MNKSNNSSKSSGLIRQMSLMGLMATGICSMLGASINVVPFMIQRHVPDIGPYVLPAFMIAAIPAILAALAYSILSSAMPRAGGSYIYASRGLHPYLGFVASFSQWFGLSIVIGVIAYIIVPFFRDIASSLGLEEFAALLEEGWLRVLIALLLVWSFVLVNIRGTRIYERTLVPLMFLMFVLGAIVIVAGFSFDHEDFNAALMVQEKRLIEPMVNVPLNWNTLLSASAILFSSFIGFDSIAQAGGEAKNPTRNLPLAIGLAITIVGCFYFIFTTAVYHAVPWNFVATEALTKDITAPGLLSYLLPTGFGVAILVGAAIALINDLPAMLLSVSRLMFAWADDGIFPGKIAEVHIQYHTPHYALIVSGMMASIGIFGSHFAGDFFLGIDIMVISMMVNFLLMCITLIMIPRVNPQLADKIRVFKNRKIQKILGYSGSLLLILFLIVHIRKDINADVDAWYFHSVLIWLIVLSGASIIYFFKLKSLKLKGVDTKALFSNLPPE